MRPGTGGAPLIRPWPYSLNTHALLMVAEARNNKIRSENRGLGTSLEAETHSLIKPVISPPPHI